MSPRSIAISFALIGVIISCAIARQPTAKATKGADGDSGVSAPPADAQWTLLCTEFTDPQHVALSTRVKNSLISQTGRHDWYLIHGEQKSTLYLGYYRSFNDPHDPKSTQRAQADRQYLASLKDNSGNPLFGTPIFVAISSPDPDAPAEWNLENAPGYWSLEIGAYTDSSDRKKQAVEAVRDARKQGLEAYYYHGESVSSVCVGSWPREAVKEQESATARSDNADQPILIVPPELASMVPKNMTDNDGHAVKTMVAKVEPEDPTLLAAMKKFKTHAVNGLDGKTFLNPRTGKMEEELQPSFLVVIPHADATKTVSSPETDINNVPQQPGDSVARPVTPGAGRLRSLGD